MKQTMILGVNLFVNFFVSFTSFLHILRAPTQQTPNKTTLHAGESTLYGIVQAINNESITDHLPLIEFCAVFSLQLTCDRDDDPHSFEESWSEKDQIVHFSKYKAQGSLYYSADDYELLVTISEKIRELLLTVAQTREGGTSILVSAIEESMNSDERGVTSSFASFVCFRSYPFWNLSAVVRLVVRRSLFIPPTFPSRVSVALSTVIM